MSDQFCAKLRGLSVAAITPADVYACLSVHWFTKYQTMRRLRAQLEAVFDWSVEQGWRDAGSINPALRAHFKRSLPPVVERDEHGGRVERHFPAMPYDQVASFLAKLRQADTIAAKALIFITLTALRTEEGLGLKWSEVDWDRAVVTIPSSRMKAGRSHVCPLSPQALALLRELQDTAFNDWVFPGFAAGKHITSVAMYRYIRPTGYCAHGMRSAFCDFAGDLTDVPREVAEAALPIP